MDLLASVSIESRFAAYVEDLVAVIGHADPVVPLRMTTAWFCRVENDLLFAHRRLARVISVGRRV
jgi:hypothetical protein